MQPSFVKARNIYARLFGSLAYKQLAMHFTGNAAQDHIRNGIAGDKPFMAARFGYTELDCMTKYRASQAGIKKYFDYLRGGITNYEIDEVTIKDMPHQSGFFPPTIDNLKKFSKLMIDDSNQVDVLGSWLTGERYFLNEMKNVIRIRLRDIEPYYHLNPWSVALRHKKVLVVHPFEETIVSQYKKRDLIFTNPDVLPEFELKTIKAVQAVVGSKTEFVDWFQALDSMKKKMDSIDFDVAIIGCGAFGFPLAAHVKRMGKKSVHMGGATQLLFGIMGRRWNDNKEIMAMLNDSWTHPSESERPQNFKKMEDGAYW